MTAFVWDRHFETGIASVDEQHRGLVQVLNRLGDSLVADEAGASAALQPMFDELLRYAREHFGDEERLMRDEGLDPTYIAAHTRTHAEFAEHVTSRWKRRQTMKDARERLVGFLVAWLGFHILGEDQEMAVQIAAMRRGVRASDAYRETREIRIRTGARAR